MNAPWRLPLFEPALDEPDAKTLAVAARSYKRWRGRYWRCFLGMPALLALLGPPIYVFDNAHNSMIHGILTVVLVVGWLACWVGVLLYWLALFRFRCPGCGKQFTISWWSSWPTNRCKHCDLDLS